MQKKTQGFAIVEVAIFVLVMLVLSLLFLFIIRPSLREVRDIQRDSALQSISLIIRADNVEKQGVDKYFYALSDEKGTSNESHLSGIREIFSYQDYRIPESVKNICYFLALGEGSRKHSGSDNQFLVAVWGEGMSTLQNEEEGVLAKGTREAVDVFLENKFITKHDFSCEGDFFLLKEIFREAGGERAFFFFIDEAGEIQELF